MKNQHNDAASKTVLLVDDEQAVLNALRRVLERDGYRVFAETDPHEALKLLNSESVDVLVSDLMMPNLDGTELLSTAKETHPNVVRIALSGSTSVDVAKLTVNDGEVYRYLTKPITARDLSDTVRNAIERREELVRLARMSATKSQRSRLLRELEREHPGITSFEMKDGTYEISAERLEDVETSLADTPWSRFTGRRGGHAAVTIRVPESKRRD